MALENGQFETALSAASEAIRDNNKIPEAFQIQGIALSRLDRREEAVHSLREAYLLASTVSKHAYNLAVILRDTGRKDEAIGLARETIKLQPDHAGAQALLHELAGEPIPNAKSPKIETVPEASIADPDHLLPFMYGMERSWNAIGAVFILMGFALAVLMFTHLPMGPTGAPVAKGKLPEIGLRRDPLSLVVSFLYIVSSICTFMWMLIDIVDKRRKFSWMVPVLACGTLGMNVVPLAFYYFLGRRLIRTPS